MMKFLFFWKWANCINHELSYQNFSVSYIRFKYPNIEQTFSTMNSPTQLERKKWIHTIRLHKRNFSSLELFLPILNSKNHMRKLSLPKDSLKILQELLTLIFLSTNKFNKWDDIKTKYRELTWLSAWPTSTGIERETFTI